jgi:hypothetical protein
MKNAFGKVMFVVIMALSSIAMATDPTPQPYLSTANDCEVPMGFMSAHYIIGSTDYGIYTAVVLGPYPGGGYYARAVYDSSGNMQYTNFRVTWSTTHYQWEVSGGAQSQAISSCVNDFYMSVNSKTPAERQDLPGLYDEYFPPIVPESRLPIDDDLDGDGRPDRFDLECPHYDDYVEYCNENDLDVLDLLDYVYWYEHSLEDYIDARDQYYDSDLDGFSDGYEIVHGTDMNDSSSYPLGRPDMGTANQIMGGAERDEPWRYDQYQNSDWSKGHVYDMGYDPFGDTPIEEINSDFVGPPDWFGMDSDGDGLNNGAEMNLGTNPYQFNFHQSSHYTYDDLGGFWKYVGGVTDADFPFPDPPTLEEALARLEEYVPDENGNYTHNPGMYEFGDPEYDARLQKFEKIKFDVDSVRPVQERDYQVHFNIPIPGGSEQYTVSVMPDTGSPGGAALDGLRRMVRALSAVIISYVFVKHVWTVIRQY